MGKIELPSSGHSIYLDACVFIYRLEMVVPFAALLSPMWRAFEHNSLKAKTSELTLVEVLVKPIREKDRFLTDLYRKSVCQAAGFSTIGITLELLESAAVLRARHKLSTPDAIHAATALAAGCAQFITNDPVFRRVPNLNVTILSEL